MILKKCFAHDGKLALTDAHTTTQDNKGGPLVPFTLNGAWTDSDLGTMGQASNQKRNQRSRHPNISGERYTPSSAGPMCKQHTAPHKQHLFASGSRLSSRLQVKHIISLLIELFMPIMYHSQSLSELRPTLASILHLISFYHLAVTTHHHEIHRHQDCLVVLGHSNTLKSQGGIAHADMTAFNP